MQSPLGFADRAELSDVNRRRLPNHLPGDPLPAGMIRTNSANSSEEFKLPDPPLDRKPTLPSGQGCWDPSMSPLHFRGLSSPNAPQHQQAKRQGGHEGGDCRRIQMHVEDAGVSYAG